MNDPGLHEPAQEAAEDVEKNTYEEERKQAEREEREYLGPSRWWFASTACPLIAGTFGPMANAFSICALPVTWRVYIPPGADEGHAYDVEDPKWLIAINSISLIFALVANISLLLNMARRVSFAVAQPITLVGFYTASLLLMALVAVASSPVFRIQPMQEHALSQAYYYAMIASGLYFIIASLMAFTVYGAYKDHYPKEFRLSPSQRTLMLQTISFMFYLLLGALVYSRVEGWNFLDAVFWADFTLLTVGLGGEFVPTTHTGRSLLFPYAIGGLVMVGLVIGSIRSLVLEHGKQKMAARYTETKRQRVLSSYNCKTKTVRLGPFQKMKYSDKAESEFQRREQEFQIMRRVLELSEKNRRYTSLAISTTAALLLWFLGALVFLNSEKPQQWTYFTALYFAYTSLLTIGYGDFVPQSNAGKVFFVFWSLLAVPTLTILISNMGDTIIKSFKDFTIWIGSLTVLPEEEGLLSAMKISFKRLGKGRIRKERDYCEVTPVSAEKHMLERLNRHVNGEKFEQAGQTGETDMYLDDADRDTRFYHLILSLEIGQLMKDVDASPPRQYTYLEWAYYLRLLGQDEHDRSAHRKPRVDHQHGKDDSPDLGTADDGDDQTWSWLGIRSPLMGNSNEAQWLLRRFSTTLMSEMRNLNSPNASRKKLSPVSLAMLQAKEKSHGVDDSEAVERGHSPTGVKRRK